MQIIETKRFSFAAIVDSAGVRLLSAFVFVVLVPLAFKAAAIVAMQSPGSNPVFWFWLFILGAFASLWESAVSDHRKWNIFWKAVVLMQILAFALAAYTIGATIAIM